MNKGTKWGLAGLAAIVSTALLVSFTNDSNDDKKKKYQIIHQSNGEVETHDTLIPMTSTYSVEQFLADKGIENKDVEIITIPDMSGFHSGMHSDLKGDVMMREFVHNIDIDIDGDHDGKMIKIVSEMDDDGKMTTKKFVDGEEVTLTEEELEKIHIRHEQHEMHKEHHDMRQEHFEMHKEEGNVIKMRVNSEGEEGEHNVEMTVEVDDDGNHTVKKVVNGEEVEMTEEEMENIHHFKGDGEHEMIFITEGEISELEGLTEELEIKIEELLEGLEGIETEGEEKRVFIKTITCEEDGLHELEMNDAVFDFEWTSDDDDHVVRTISSEGGEDFTIVLVTENIDESAHVERKMKINTSKETSSFETFPNPTDGTVTVRFDQDEKVKTNVKITDVKGKVVFQDKLGKFSGVYEKEIDLKQFGAGTYVISIQRGEDVEAKKVIVK